MASRSMRAHKRPHGLLHGLALGWILEQIRHDLQQFALQEFILYNDCCAALSEIIGIHFLIPPGMRVGDENSRKTKECKFSQCRGARSCDDQIGGGQRRSHLFV